MPFPSLFDLLPDPHLSLVPYPSIGPRSSLHRAEIDEPNAKPIGRGLKGQILEVQSKKHCGESFKQLVSGP